MRLILAVVLALCWLLPMTPAAGATQPLLGTTYNVGNASDARVRADLLRLAATRVPVIGLQEVGDRRDVIHGIPGYQTFQAPAGHGARAHVALLVRADLPASGFEVHRISRRTWVGHHVAGARRTGFAEAKYVASVDAAGRRYGVTHFVPSSMVPGNHLARRLYREQACHAAAWMRLHPGAVLLGDFNAGPGGVWYPPLRPLRRVARGYAAGRSHGFPRDIAWVSRHVAHRRREFHARSLSGFSSDHPPVELLTRRTP